ncbi:MAG: S8 family serine peptidase, partial [Phycicoccus sp.]
MRLGRTFAAVAVVVGGGVPAAGASAAEPACAEAAGVFRDEPTPVQRYHGARSLWSVSTGRGVTIAVLSTGVDRTNLQLTRRLAGNGLDVIGGKSSRGDDDSSRADVDCDGDGTFAAGVIAAAPTDVTSFHGIAPGATVLPIRVAQTVRVEGSDRLELAGGGPQEIADGIRAATAARVRIICVTTTTPEDSPAQRSAVREAVQAGVLVVSGGAGAGAGGKPSGASADEAGPAQYPSVYPDVLAVGATSLDGQLLPSSPRGPWIDISAPAQGVVSTAPVGTADTPGHTKPVDDPAAATAAVAAAAALILERAPRADPGEVRGRLTGTATLPARITGVAG